MNHVKAPQNYESEPRPWIFLAGSIEMGKAEDWQESVGQVLSGHQGTLLNPRRDDWDSSWVQSIDNANFREQVEWELSGLERADKVILYLSPGTKSPISLLELGLFIEKDLWVCCPDGFWRKGNVEIVCARHGKKLYESLGGLLNDLCRGLAKTGKVGQVGGANS